MATLTTQKGMCIIFPRNEEKNNQKDKAKIHYKNERMQKKTKKGGNITKRIKLSNKTNK